MRLFTSWSSADACVCVSHNHSGVSIRLDLCTPADATHLKCFCEVGKARASRTRVNAWNSFSESKKSGSYPPHNSSMMPLLLKPWHFLTIAIFGQTSCAARLIKQWMRVQHRRMGVSCLSSGIHSHYLVICIQVSAGWFYILPLGLVDLLMCRICSQWLF